MLEHKIHKCHKNEYNSCPQIYWSVLQLEMYSGTHTPLHGICLIYSFGPWSPSPLWYPQLRRLFPKFYWDITDKEDFWRSPVT